MNEGQTWHPTPHSANDLYIVLACSQLVQATACQFMQCINKLLPFIQTTVVAVTKCSTINGLFDLVACIVHHTCLAPHCWDYSDATRPWTHNVLLLWAPTPPHSLSFLMPLPADHAWSKTALWSTYNNSLSTYRPPAVSAVKYDRFLNSQKSGNSSCKIDKKFQTRALPDSLTFQSQISLTSKWL